MSVFWVVLGLLGLSLGIFLAYSTSSRSEAKENIIYKTYPGETFWYESPPKTLLQDEISYFSGLCTVTCDGHCHKAWGLNRRPHIQLSDDEEDVV